MKCGSGQHKLTVCATKERYIIRNGITIVWTILSFPLWYRLKLNISPHKVFMHLSPTGAYDMVLRVCLSCRPAGAANYDSALYKARLQSPLR